MPARRTFTDLDRDADPIRSARYGVIETRGGRFVQVRRRWLPKLLSLRELWPVGDRHHARGPADRCRLYYNEPRSAPGYLALRYVETTAGTGYATIRAALTALDRVAEIKRTDAIVCDAANRRLSDRILRRMGWEPHAPSPWRRNFIRRFYGVYPGSSEQRAVDPGLPTPLEAVV